jgi:hypothetical protein
LKRLPRRRLTPGMVVAVVALFVALGGTSFAAVKLLPPNSVGSAQVINGSLKKADLADSTITALKGNKGPAGAQGPAGSAGSAGPAGATGAAGANGAAGATGPAGLAGATGAVGATGPKGATGVNGTNGSTGPAGATGPAGPDFIATGLVNPDGTLGFTQGPVPTITHTVTGQYGITITLGTGCPLPSLTPYGSSVGLYWSGGSCAGGTTTTTVLTSDGLDHFWAYLFVGTGGSTDSTNSASLPQRAFPTR